MRHLVHDYRKAFYWALALHMALACALFLESSHKRPVMTREAKNQPGTQPAMIKAVSVDSQQVMQAVSALKQQRAQEQKAQAAKQQALEKQAAIAKQDRIKEQQRIIQLKEEANKIAIMRKKEVEREKEKLQALAQQQAKETERLKMLQAQQAVETKKLAALEKKKEQEKLKTKELALQADKANREKAAKAAREDLAKENRAKAAAATAQATERAANEARVSGEVDKYRALILNAIGRHWILPENVNSNLYSQFKIHLAPDGTVLDVSLMRSSGDALLDRSARTAIFKASPLPVPQDVPTFNLFRDISLTVRPEQVRG